MSHDPAFRWPPGVWLSRQEAAEYLRVPISYLDKARMTPSAQSRRPTIPGPSFARGSNGRVYYRRTALDAWANQTQIDIFQPHE